ncbi:hypothetical protein niasHT_007453 [Heterodera trifolii]|uniref:Uncharacterized protein n=1 Tax=Heterodera trifolii TaxID=157864 RepID=A0ABD2LP80_9BILA
MLRQDKVGWQCSSDSRGDLRVNDGAVFGSDQSDRCLKPIFLLTQITEPPPNDGGRRPFLSAALAARPLIRRPSAAGTDRVFAEPTSSAAAVFLGPKIITKTNSPAKTQFILNGCQNAAPSPAPFDPAQIGHGTRPSLRPRHQSVRFVPVPWCPTESNSFCLLRSDRSPARPFSGFKVPS